VTTQGSLLDGRYRVIRHLGSGGMASVLLCEDERLGRQVAVKRLHADSPVDVEQRFNREAKLGASLNHPNLVSVFDTATDDEGVLIVMEYVDGEPLSRMLRRGPLRPEEVRRLVLDVGDALDHAHAEGIIHRDVKPGNVLIREDGVTKLADLGIATASDGTKITRSGIVLGTASYMAPEQLEGGELGPAADIYALAAIAFEALSGKKPRQGTTPMQIAHQIATEGPPDLTDAWPTAPKAAADVLKRGMALDPADRQATAGEFARELAEALKEEPTKTAPTRRFMGKRRGRPAAGAAAAAAAAPAAAPAAAAPAAKSTAEPDPTPVPAAPSNGDARPPAPRPARARGGDRRPSAVVLILAIALIGLAAAAIAGGVLSGGGDDNGSPAADNPAPPAKKKPAEPKKKPKAKKEKPKKAEEPAASAPAPADDGGSYDPARGAELNRQGFDMMNAGDYAGAIPVLQEAVDSFPPGTDDVNYAYALFNLGKSLRKAGRYDEAVSVLEQRLKIPNQTATVQRELDLAKQRSSEG
jgi:eukaryotic-like serine/threonine-protein kinase